LAVLAGPAPALAADDAPELGWAAELALGGSLATGNTDRQALDLEGKARYRTEHREDRYKVLGDLTRENGAVTSERAEIGAQTNYDISKDKLYLLAFIEYRRDKFSGFQYEAEIGPGLGYRFVRTDRLTVAVEFSTGYRHGEMGGVANDDDLIFARGTATVDYQLSDTAKLTNETLITGDNQRVTIEDTISVSSSLVGDLALRASVNARYNSNPPPAVEKIDTLSKVALVYAF
jgi:putative salt-induced outer membrane protein